MTTSTCGTESTVQYSATVFFSSRSRRGEGEGGGGYEAPIIGLQLSFHPELCQVRSLF